MPTAFSNALGVGRHSPPGVNAGAPWRHSVEYKSEAAGLRVVYANPAYTSQTCSGCGSLGTRHRHRFSCSNCGFLAHSDGNAARNLAGIVLLFSGTRGVVTRPDVAA